jgi:hypothetical protein
VGAATETLGTNIDQTGEIASNLDWSEVAGNNWTLGVSTGSATQGVTRYESPGSYSVTFSEAGLPTGKNWSVTFNGVTRSSAASLIVFAETNGTYPYAIEAVSGWHESMLPYTGRLTVKGASPTEPTLVFVQVIYSLAITELGLPSGENWYVNFTSRPSPR